MAKALNRKSSVMDKLIYILSISSTMPIVGIFIAGRYISLFTIVFVVFEIYILVQSIKHNANSQIKTNFKPKNVLVIFLLTPLLGYIVGIFFMPAVWYSSMTSYLLKSIQYIIIYISICICYQEGYTSTFAKGLLIGCVINMIWSIIEIVSMQLLGESLNDILFSQYITLNRDILITNIYGGYRASGLNYDPAHLGGIIPIVLLYSLYRRNPYLLSLSLASLIASQSTTALVGCVALSILYTVPKIISNGRTLKFRKVKREKIYKTIFMLILSITLVLVLSFTGSLDTLYETGIKNIEGFSNRIDSTYIEGGATSVRSVYYSNALQLLSKRNPITILFGTGLGTSMYPYRDYLFLFRSGAQNMVTEIECNYIAYLFDLGVLGFCAYIYILISTMRQYYPLLDNSNKDTIIYYAAIASITSCGFFYHYIFTAYQILAICFASVHIDAWNKSNGLVT